MKKSIFFFAAAAALTVLSSAAFAQQAMTSGIVTKVDETQGTIRIQYSQPGTVGGSSTDTSLDARKNGQAGLSETVLGLSTPKASRTPPYGFRVPQQNANVHADP